MIGKIVSEAAHSIIGMLSARSQNMDNLPSNTDFGSLLRSSQDRPGAKRETRDLDPMEFVIADIGETDPAPSASMDMPGVLPFGEQQFRHMVSGPIRFSEQVGQEPAAEDGEAPVAREKIGFVRFNRDLLGGTNIPGLTGEPEVSETTACSAVGDRFCLYQAFARYRDRLRQFCNLRRRTGSPCFR